jgi:DNA-binding NarL/FixJ family response regulator
MDNVIGVKGRGMQETIIIADDHPIFRDGMCRLIGDILPDARLIEAGSTDDVLAAVSTHGAPAMFLLDLVFPGMNPRETISDLRQQCPTSSIVIVSMLDDAATIEKIMEYGADGFIVKSIPAAEMIEAILAVRAGEFVVARPSVSIDADQLSDLADVMELTPRQREILALLSDGRSNKEIARALALSHFTVRNHISLLMRILKVHSRGLLAAKAATLLH